MHCPEVTPPKEVFEDTPKLIIYYDIRYSTVDSIQRNCVKEEKD
jgi:hypothetical protein